MDVDRICNQGRPSFTQMFVARSGRLLNYVKSTVGREEGCTYTTFRGLVASLESRLPKSESVRDTFLASQHMDFARFKRDVHCGSAEIHDSMDQYFGCF